MNWRLVVVLTVIFTALLLVGATAVLPAGYLATGLVTDGCVLVAGLTAYGVEHLVWRRRTHCGIASRPRDAAVRSVSIEDLERQEETVRREEADELTHRIAAAECVRYGHVDPEGGPAADTVNITSWGSMTPIRLGPYCVRCGANLSKETA